MVNFTPAELLVVSFALQSDLSTLLDMMKNDDATDQDVKDAQLIQSALDKITEVI